MQALQVRRWGRVLRGGPWDRQNLTNARFRGEGQRNRAGQPLASFSDSVLNFNWSSLPEPNTPSSFESISANQEDADAPSLPAVSVDKVDGNMKRAKIMSGATVTACTEAPP